MDESPNEDESIIFEDNEDMPKTGAGKPSIGKTKASKKPALPKVSQKEKKETPELKVVKDNVVKIGGKRGRPFGSKAGDAAERNQQIRIYLNPEQLAFLAANCKPKNFPKGRKLRPHDHIIAAIEQLRQGSEMKAFERYLAKRKDAASAKVRLIIEQFRAEKKGDK